ncbi:MAG: type III pantothenate kinase [Glaciecola sp.]
MSEEPKLLIDVGNTSIKVANYDPVTTSMAPIQRFKLVEELRPSLERASHAYLSNVGKDEVSAEIRSLCVATNTPLFIARTEAEAHGLTNSYLKPSNMGVDRWLAMLACMRRSSQKTFLVVDIGTAMTIDAVENGKHLGGWIVPGVSLMRESLFKNTQRVFGDAENKLSTEFANDTPDCVSNGCNAQILGTLLLAEQQMQKKVKKFELFLTGGDKNLFLNLNIQNKIECENLVLEGLTLFVD